MRREVPKISTELFEQDSRSPLLLLVLALSVAHTQWEDCWRLYKRGDVNLNGIQYEVGDAVVFVRVRIYGEEVILDSCQYWTSDMDLDGVPFTVNDLQLLLEAIQGGEFLNSSGLSRKDSLWESTPEPCFPRHPWLRGELTDEGKNGYIK